MRHRLLAAAVASILAAMALGGTALAGPANPNASCAGAVASNQVTPGDAAGIWSATNVDNAFYGQLGNRNSPGDTSGRMGADFLFCVVTH